MLCVDRMCLPALPGRCRRGIVLGIVLLAASLLLRLVVPRDSASLGGAR